MWGSRSCWKPWTTPGVPCVMLSFPPVGYLPDPASCPFLSLYMWQNLLNYRAHMHLSLSNDL